MCVLCLSGPASEAYYVGRIEDGSDATDYQMAREYLFDAGFNVFTVHREILRLRAAADRLVRTEKKRICLIAAALLARGCLTGDEVAEL
jgi:hypothetical protein